MATPEVGPTQEIKPDPKYWYEPTQIPTQGDWPQGIKVQWVGVRLPVKENDSVLPPRDSRLDDPYGLVAITKDGFVKVGVDEAVSALRLVGREQAADFWVATAKSSDWQEDQPLYFRLDEGQLIDSATGQVVDVPVMPYPASTDWSTS